MVLPVLCVVILYGLSVLVWSTGCVFMYTEVTTLQGSYVFNPYMYMELTTLQGVLKCTWRLPLCRESLHVHRGNYSAGSPYMYTEVTTLQGVLTCTRR